MNISISKLILELEDYRDKHGEYMPYAKVYKMLFYASKEDNKRVPN